MSSTPEYILVNRETMNGMIKKEYTLSYMVMILSVVCEVNEVIPYLPVKGICGILNITEAQFRECEQKGWIKGIAYGEITVYEPMAIAELGGKLRKRKRLRMLKKLTCFRPPVTNQ